MAGYGTTAGDGTGGDEGPGWSAIIGSSPAGSSDITGPATGGSTSIGIGAAALDTSSVAGTAIGTTVGAASVDLGDTAVAAMIIGAAGTASLGMSSSVSAAAATLAGSTTDLTLSSAAMPSAIGTAEPALSLDITSDSDAAVFAVGVGEFEISMVSEGVSNSMEDPEFIVAESPELMPLQESHEADSLERELKQILISLFEDNLREGERYVNALGMPHLGPRELIDDSLTANGIPIYRGASSADSSGAYLLRAWLARNPKRGLHMLKHMLQMLWPNAATVNQMWQEKAEDYPTALVTLEDIPPGDEDDYFLTSRVHVTLPARVTTGGDVAAIQSGLRATLPARMLLNLAIEEEAAFGIGLTSVFYKGCVAQSYEGTFN